ncbi:MAG: hypothetical protein LBC75_04505 [Fibromonadaceae bacterium]|jgi:pterin-4a-carbinolamine dehydratase|nr:hypothetical protein [Fibromonadaceae bacterium]
MEPSLFETFLKIAICCVKRKGLFVMSFTLPCLLAAFVIWFVLEPKYKATAVFTTTPTTSGVANLGMSAISEFLKMPGMGGGGGGGSKILSSFLSQDNKEELLVAYSKSWEFYDNLAKKFDLEKHYKVKTKYKADLYKMISRNINLDWNKDDMLELSVTDKDFKMARAINDHIVYLLDSTYAVLGTHSINKKRKFFELQLDSATKDLIAIEEKFIKFQNDNRFYDFYSQLTATMEFLTTRSLAKIAVDDELGHKGQSAQHEKLRLHLSNIDNQLQKSKDYRNNTVPLLELDKAPELAVQHTQLELELKNQFLRYINLLQICESIKFEEMDRTDAILRISSAWDNPQKTSPPRTVLMLVFIGVFGVLSVFLCVFAEWHKGDSNSSRLLRSFFAELRGR